MRTTNWHVLEDCLLVWQYLHSWRSFWQRSSTAGGCDAGSRRCCRRSAQWSSWRDAARPTESRSVRRVNITPTFIAFNPLYNPLESRGNYSATSNTMKLAHWPLMGGLLHLVQRGEDWAGPQPAQAHPHCTKCNIPPINGLQCTNHRIAV